MRGVHSHTRRATRAHNRNYGSPSDPCYPPDIPPCTAQRVRIDHFTKTASACCRTKDWAHPRI